MAKQEKAKKLKNQLSAEEEALYRRAKNWQIALFNMASGSGMLFYVLMTYVSYIANEAYGVAVAVTGLIITGTRILDGFTDPICALIIDRFKTKHGKIRILMCIGWAIEAIAISSMYIFGSSGNNGVVFFIACYVVYIIGYTIYGVSTNIVGPVMTNDPRQRPLLARWQTLYSYIFPMVFNIVITMMILPKYDNVYNVSMLKETCWYVIIGSGILTLLACVGVSEFDKIENFISLTEDKKEKKIGTKDMVNLLKNNRAFKLYIAAAVSDKIALATAGQAIVNTLFYGMLIGNIQLGTIFSIITMLPSIVFVFVATRLAVKRGNMESMLVWTKSCIAIALVAIGFCVVNDMTNIMRSIVPTVIFFAIMLLFSGFKMGVSANTGSMMSDLVDYEMSRTSSFMPGTVAATYSFIDKLVSSLSSTIAAFCVALVGYKTVMPQPGDTMTTPIFGMTMLLMFGFPILGWICSLIAMRKYPLTKEIMVEVQARNKEIKDAAAEVVAQG